MSYIPIYTTVNPSPCLGETRNRYVDIKILSKNRPALKAFCDENCGLSAKAHPRIYKIKGFGYGSEVNVGQMQISCPRCSRSLYWSREYSEISRSGRERQLGLRALKRQSVGIAW